MLDPAGHPFCLYLDRGDPRSRAMVIARDHGLRSGHAAAVPRSAVILGGSVAGGAAALQLARAGWQVTLVDP